MVKRFSRQSKISWWNQRKISDCNIILVGCGGIGTWTALQLTMLGIRKIILIDLDRVEESNLNRQMFYETDIGKYKVEALKEKLSSINSKLQIEIYDTSVQSVHDDTYKNVTAVFDCLDNIETREYLADLCWKKKIPLLHSACSDVIGEVQICIKGKTNSMKEYPQDMKEEQEKRSCKDFDPAVCTTNMIVASLQVDKFLNYLIKKDVKKPYTNYIRGFNLSFGV